MRARGAVSFLMIGALVAGLMAAGTLVAYVVSSEKAKNQLEVLQEDHEKVKGERDQARRSAQQNQASFEQCQQLNAENEAAAERARTEVAKAKARLESLEALALLEEEEIRREAETFRGRALSCPALDHEFRLWVLRDAPGIGDSL